MTAYIADGEFPDDELTDITYMLESNDNYDDLLHDLAREDDGEGTKVKTQGGQKVVVLADVVAAIEAARGSDLAYQQAIKPYVDEQD